jgi:hypothetical protein
MTMTKKAPKKVGYYWLSILKKDGTPKKNFPRIVQVEVDDRSEVGSHKIKKGTLVAPLYWSSANPKSCSANYLWSAKIEEPK